MFKTRKEKIINLYKQILCREPDEKGLISYIKSNLNLEDIKNDLLASTERNNLLFSDKLLIDVSKIYHHKSKVLDFYDTDTSELFVENKKKMGKEWIWYDKPITYELNSLGYRMKEFENIDWTNYMMVLGCSHTFGTGMPFEDLFSTRISKNLNMDIVNAAIPGGANNAMLINLNKLLSKKTPPKLIICNWTFLHRWSYMHGDTIIRHGITKILPIENYYDESYINYLQNDFQIHGTFIEMKKQIDTLCKYANIPIWHITSVPQYDFDKSIEKIFPDVARDTINQINQNIARDYLHKSGSHFGYSYNNRVYDRWMQIKHNLGF